MGSSKSETCCGNLAELLQKFQRDIHFVKKLGTSHVGRPNPSATNKTRLGTCQLTIPQSFVKAHGDKFQKSVVLHSGNKTWTVRLSICPSRSPPEVVLCNGWRRFVGDNGLAYGDTLIFYWTAMSTFEVYMFNSCGESKGPQILRMQPFTNGINALQQKKGSKPVGENKLEELTDEEFENLLNEESICGRSSRRTEASLPAAFQKRLRLRSKDCALEIPVHFGRKYCTRMQRRLHLQGIHKDSPVQVVSFYNYMGRGRKRFYLTEGWAAFWKENMLREGQELVFTLVSDSFFKVREAGTGPRSGMNSPEGPGSISEQ